MRPLRPPPPPSSSNLRHTVILPLLVLFTSIVGIDFLEARAHRALDASLPAHSRAHPAASPPAPAAARSLPSPAATVLPKPAAPVGLRAPKPRVLDLTAAALRASEALVDGSSLQGAPPPVGMARPALTLPGSCWGDLGYNKTRDAECYWTMDAVFQRERSVEEEMPYCWGRDGGEGGAAGIVAAGAGAAAGATTGPGTATGKPGLLLHTLLLSPKPLKTLRLLYWSFLATQCCDAVLWVWVAPEVMAEAVAHLEGLKLPTTAASRLQLRAWDAATAFEELAGGASPLLPLSSWMLDAADGGGVKAATAAAAALAGAASMPARALWARLLLLARWGGAFFECDTALLRDWRPLLRLGVPWGYRDAFNIYAAGGALSLAPLPAPLTAHILMETLRTRNPSSMAVSYEAVGPRRLSHPKHFALLAEALFDMTWYRVIGASHEHYSLYSVHPEISRERGWLDFFLPASDETLARRVVEADGSFMSGSFSYHYHALHDYGDGNRARTAYDGGLPQSSWAGLLVERFERLARRKEGVCAA